MSNRVPQLYGLRAVAILLVVLTHLWNYPPGYVLLNRIAAAGWIGVQLSFVLSGFLITKILWRTRDDAHYYMNFYARRSLRIFPLYYVLLALVFIVLPMMSRLPAHLEHTQWMYWLYLSNFALAAHGWQLFISDITWSLAVEEQFYLVWPLLVRRVSKERMIFFCLVIVLVTPLARGMLWTKDAWMWIHMMMPLRADAFAVGALIALLPGNVTSRLARPIFALCGVALATLIVTGSLPRNSMLAGTIGHSLVALVAGAGLILGMQVRALAWKPFVHIGTVSYGIYIFHPLCLMVMSTLLTLAGLNLPGLPGALIRLVATAAVAVAVATASYYLFESRVLQLKRFFSADSTARELPMTQRSEAKET